MKENRKTVRMREGEGRLGVAPGKGGNGGDSLAAGGEEAQGRERAREIGQMTAPLKGSVVHSPFLFPLSHLLMLIFITLLKILIIN